MYVLYVCIIVWGCSICRSFSKLYASKGVIELKKGHPEVAKYNFKLAMDLLRSDAPAISNYTCAG